MALGFGILRLDPRAFWSMTPKELAAAARAVTGHHPASGPHLARSDLTALMAAYPDVEPPHD